MLSSLTSLTAASLKKKSLKCDWTFAVPTLKKMAEERCSRGAVIVIVVVSFHVVAQLVSGCCSCTDWRASLPVFGFYSLLYVALLGPRA